MSDETNVVKEGEVETPTDSTPVENEQETDSEVVENTSDIQENLKVALQKERERRKAAEAQLKQPAPAPEMNDDPVYQRFQNVEATTLINNKLLTDPTFKDRVDLVQDEMIRTGKSMEDADNAVIARLFRDMTANQTPEAEKPKVPNNLPNKAIPDNEEKIDPKVQEELDYFDEMEKNVVG